MEINGIDRVCLRDSGSSIDVCSRSWINENDLLGEYVWLKSPLDEICHCLPLAKIKIKKRRKESFYTKAAVKQDSSDNDLYLLGNRTAELLESDEQGVHLVNAVGGEDDSFIIPAFEGEGGKSLAKVNGVEFKEEQRKCPDLKPLWDKALTGIDKEFRVIRGKLVRVAKTKRREEVRQLCVPIKFRLDITKLSHDEIGGHLGVTKTKDRILRHFLAERVQRRGGVRQNLRFVSTSRETER
ncbi:integrase_H2C2 domain-containing protein [Trichonephila clavipes]|nr:integrase_H2C2 domain-containing protein [Trichonephila clavipes]